MKRPSHTKLPAPQTLRSRGYRPVSDDRIRGTWLKTRWKEEYNRNA